MPAIDVAMRPTLFAAALAVALSGCRAESAPRPISDESPARRTAQSFVHCIEQRGGLCVSSEQVSQAWDALYLLIWMAEGSPVSLLSALRPQLERHADLREIQRRFVDTVDRYAVPLRGAECDAQGQQPLGQLIEEARAQAKARLQSFGLWQGGLPEVVERLAAEAHADLDDGYLVRLDCNFDPFRVWTAVRERDGQYAVVGMTTLLPKSLGGEVLSPEMVDERLRSRWLGLGGPTATIAESEVHPWLPFPVEEL